MENRKLKMDIRKLIGRFFQKLRPLSIFQYHPSSIFYLLSSLYIMFALLIFILSNSPSAIAANNGTHHVFPNSNMGIGTTAPSVALHTVGSARVSGLDCTGNTNGGAITGDASGNLSCSDDANTDTIWSHSTGLTYLTSLTDDLAIGANSLTAPFSVDESLNTVRVGEGSNSNGTLEMYASDGSTGSIIYSTSDAWGFLGGNVGIETSAPEVKLDITNGNTAGDNAVEIDAFSPGNPFLGFESSGTRKWTIGVDDNGSDNLKIGTTSITTNTALTLQSNGTVGIGTTGPSTKLNVVALGATSICALSGDANSYTGIGIGRTDLEGSLGIAAAAGQYATGAAAGDLVLRNESSSKKLLLGAGSAINTTITSNNVGIGITAPSSKLSIQAANTTATVLNVMRIQRMDSDSAGANGLGTAIDFYLEDAGSNMNQAARIDVVWEDASNGSEDSSMRFNLVRNGTLAEAMRIDDNGNVGMGCTAPNAQLEIEDNGTVPFMISSDDLATNGDFMIITTAGNVGIGDTSPDALLEVADTGADVFMISDASTGNGDRLIVRTDGNVGIGDVGPDARFELVELGTTPLMISSTAAGNGDYMFMNTSGNLGIGQTNPALQFEISLPTGGSYMLARSDAGTTVDELLGKLAFDSTDGDSTVDASVMIQGFSSETQASTDKGGYLKISLKVINDNDDDAATERMRILANGNIGIGRSAPVAKLQAAGRQVQIGDAGTVNTATGDGDLYVEDALEVGGSCTGASANCNDDVAEEFESLEGVEAGDIVILNTSEYKTVQHSLKPYDSQTIGVVSTKPTIIMSSGDFRKHPVPIALNGVAPVKVNLENGPIKIGDYITSSSTPGVGMKATKAGKVLGISLEKFDEKSLNEKGVGKVIHFIDVHWWDADDGKKLEILAATINSQQKMIEEQRMINKRQQDEIEDRRRRIKKLSKK